MKKSLLYLLIGGFTIFTNCNKDDAILDSDQDDEATLDSDQDGIMDNLDLCPGTPNDETVDGNGCSYLYLDENGVTVKATEDAEVGKSYKLDGTSYLIVDKALLQEMIRKNESVRLVCTSKITNMFNLLGPSTIDGEGSFNDDLSSWDVSNVTDMSFLFSGQNAFNGNISFWNVSSVTSMSHMFLYSMFNQDISLWDVSSVRTMDNMFSGSDFDQDIDSWDVSSVTHMGTMFSQAGFNQDISSWDVSNVIVMSLMFSQITGDTDSFNQDISSWDVSSVTNMSHMFKYSDFNQDLSSWDVSSVIKCDNFSIETSWSLPKPNFTNCTP